MRFKKAFIFLVVILLSFTLYGCSLIELNERELAEVKTYIESTEYKTFSFMTLMEKLKLSEEQVYLNEIKFVLGNDGYLDVVYLEYYVNTEENKYGLIYQREEGYFGIDSEPIENQHSEAVGNNIKILEDVDRYLKDIKYSEEIYNQWFVYLKTPREVCFVFNNETVYLNGTLVEKTKPFEVEGTVFVVYGAPTGENDDAVYHIIKRGE